MKISLIVPVYNEQKRLPKYFPELMNAMMGFDESLFEILIVDDGSNDETPRILRELQNKYQKILKIISLPSNMGKGFAIKEGVNQSNGGYIFYSDIDLSVNLESALPAAIKILQKGTDIVIGSRRLPNSLIKVHQPLIRETLGHIFTKLANLVLGTSYSDLTCGFKGFTRNAAQQLFGELQCGRWSYDAEILYRASKLGLHTKELAVEWRNDFDTKIKISHDIFVALLDLIKIRTRHVSVDSRDIT